MDTGIDSERKLSDYLAILRRRWVFVAVPLLILPWATFYYSANQPDEFVSEAEVFLGDTAAQAATDAGSQSTSFRNRLLENELRLARGDAAQTEIARRFGVAVEDIPDAIVIAANDIDVLVFRSTSENAESAANVANAWAETYTDLKAEQTLTSIEGAIEQLETRLAELLADREALRSDLTILEDQLATATDLTREQAQLRVDRETSRISGQVLLVDTQILATVAGLTDLRLTADLSIGNGPQIISRATPAAASSTPPAPRNIALGLLAGAILGMGLALLRDSLDDAVRTPSDLEALGLLHLGSIPLAKNKRKIETDQSSLEVADGPQASAYQKVQNALDFVAHTNGVKSIVVSSALQGEGKTTLSSNVAIALAQSNRRTILIDGDLRRPRVHKVFHTKQSPGISEVVMDTSTLASAAWPIAALAESLVVIPSGALPPHPTSFISSPAFASAMHSLSSLGDFTIIDAPPLLPVADSLALAKHVGGVVLVVRAGKTPKADLQRALASLAKAGALVIGAVLIGTRAKQRTYEYSGSEQVERLSVDELTLLASAKTPSPKAYEPANLFDLETAGTVD